MSEEMLGLYKSLRPVLRGVVFICLVWWAWRKATAAVSSRKERKRAETLEEWMDAQNRQPKRRDGD